MTDVHFCSVHAIFTIRNVVLPKLLNNFRRCPHSSENFQRSVLPLGGGLTSKFKKTEGIFFKGAVIHKMCVTSKGIQRIGVQSISHYFITFNFWPRKETFDLFILIAL